MVEQLHDLERVRPPTLPEGPSLALGTVLAGARRRVYEVTDPSNQFALPQVLEGFKSEPTEFRCGHTCRYMPAEARHICREIEPYAVCLWCLTTALGDLLYMDFYPEFVSDKFFPTDRSGHAAAARYYVSLLELYHELASRAGTKLYFEQGRDERGALDFLIWDQLTGFTTEQWLTEDGNLSVLQGALQFIRHIARGKELYDNDHIGLAERIGLQISLEL